MKKPIAPFTVTTLLLTAVGGEIVEPLLHHDEALAEHHDIGLGALDASPPLLPPVGEHAPHGDHRAPDAQRLEARIAASTTSAPTMSVLRAM